MRSTYLRVKIAFFVVALLTVSWRCAAQCAALACNQTAAEAPPCHAHHLPKHEAPANSCKPSLLVAEEVPIQSIQEPAVSPDMPLQLVFLGGVGGYTSTTKACEEAWATPTPPAPSETAGILPLRI